MYSFIWELSIFLNFNLKKVLEGGRVEGMQVEKERERRKRETEREREKEMKGRGEGVRKIERENGLFI